MFSTRQLGGRVVLELCGMLCLSERLPAHYPNFFGCLKSALDDHRIPYKLLRPTKDVWMRDFMPVKGADGQWVQFRYAPDYLQRSARGRSTITDPQPLLEYIGVEVVHTDIVADGGNFVRCGRTVLTCHKLFRENPSWTSEDLLAELKRLLGVERILLVPQEPGDRFGHADGMARFLNQDTVLVNDYSWRHDHLRWDLRACLFNAGLKVIDVPYDPRSNSSTLSAKSNYINFLRYNGIVFLPVFGNDLDATVLGLFRQWFRIVVPVLCEELAEDGGLLHCISWEH